MHRWWEMSTRMPAGTGSALAATGSPGSEPSAASRGCLELAESRLVVLSAECGCCFLYTPPPVL